MITTPRRKATIEGLRRLQQGGFVDLSRTASLARAVGLLPALLRIEDLETLESVPPWLAVCPAKRKELARRAALAMVAPSLRRTIDGDLLRAVSAVVGDAMLDWATAQQTGDPRIEIPANAAALDALGTAVLRAMLPPALNALLSEGDLPHAVPAATIVAAFEAAQIGVAPA